MKTNALLFINNAQMAKLADASDLNSDDYYNHAGSIPALSTFINLKNDNYESKEINSSMGSKRKKWSVIFVLGKTKKVQILLDKFKYIQ